MFLLLLASVPAGDGSLGIKKNQFEWGAGLFDDVDVQLPIKPGKILEVLVVGGFERHYAQV